MTETEQLLLLNMIPNIGSVRLQKLLRHFGTLGGVFSADENELIKVEKIGPRIARCLRQYIKEADIIKELQLIKKHNVEIITFLDRRYPSQLKNIYDPPMVLYVKGNILPQDDLAISIVGSRMASFYGIQTAERLAFELASRGITIISGLAHGIDASAHRGALKAKGRTIAVLGSGLMYIYPKEHNKLAESIIESGALVSEFPMTTIPDRRNFPRRNRIISGLSRGVICIEAGQHSGALITCDYALDQGREVFAVPGKIDSPTSKGTNRLIKQGAKLVETVDDVLEELKMDIHVIPCRERTLQLDNDEKAVYNLLSSEPRHIDDLYKETQIKTSRLTRILSNLEIKKLVKALPGKLFVKIGEF